MKSNDLRYVNAEFDDLDSILKIENEFFGDYSKAFDIDFFKKWFDYNSDMFYVVKDNSNNVLAFTILTPITKSAYDKLLNGFVSDMYDFNFDDVLKCSKSDYYYVSDICISKRLKFSYLKCFTVLLNGIINILSKNTFHIVTSPVTREGIKLCEGLGFKKVSEKSFDGKVYSICELLITDNKVNRFSKILR